MPIKPVTDKEKDVDGWYPSWDNPSWDNIYDYDQDSEGEQHKADTGLKKVKECTAKYPVEFNKETLKKPLPGNCVCTGCASEYLKALEEYNYYVKSIKLYQSQLIAEKYLKEKMEEKAAGNPLLPVNTIQVQKAMKKSVPGSSHDKSGKYGGQSSYSDSDVMQARDYMQEVLGIEAMSINGRDLAHILAEVYGFAQRNNEKELREVKAKLQIQIGLEVNVKELSKGIAARDKEITKLRAELDAAQRSVEIVKKLEQGPVAKTSTVRRIKE